MHSTSSVSETSTGRAWLQLCRLPNVFTALADVLAGWYFVTAISFDRTLAALLGASACLYTAGMVLNDVFDVEVDRLERPKRPLPSGRIGMAQARAFGWALLVVGAVCGFVAAAMTGSAGPAIVTTLLAILIVGYDAWLKSTPLGPVAMGGCRMLNVLLGMSVAMNHWQTAHYLFAGGMGVYVVGFTLFARREAGESSRAVLAAALAIMIAGVGLVASVARFVPPDFELQLEPTRWWLLVGLIFAVTALRCLAAIITLERAQVQVAVKQAIMSIIFLDAAVCALTRGVEPALTIVALMIPTVILGRYVYST